MIIQMRFPFISGYGRAGEKVYGGGTLKIPLPENPLVRGVIF
jgi:hypothetical protein